MNARTITTTLKGRWCGSYGMARCPVHADRTPSLKISDSDSTSDGIDVVCFAGCDWKDIKGEMRAMGLLPGFELGRAQSYRTKQYRHEPAKPDPRKLANIEHAKGLWAATKPATGTHVETYLRKRRIIVEIPPTIRLHPHLLHAATGVQFPAMVVGLSGPDKKISGVQRTYLGLDGQTKASVSNVKMTLGRKPGDAARLGPATNVLGVAEGVETGLSAMQIYGGSVWCACGSTLDKIALPDIVRHVRVYADNGDAGQKAAAKAVEAYRAQGRDVSVINPPSQYGDFNDILTARIAA